MDKSKVENPVEFFLPMEHVPTVTHQEHDVRIVNGRPVFYDPPELKAVRQKYRDMLAQHRPPEKLTGPLQLQVIWCFLTDRHADGAWRITKPDTDNLQKLLNGNSSCTGAVRTARAIHTDGAGCLIT